jgi:hypothetical protein
MKPSIRFPLYVTVAAAAMVAAGLVFSTGISDAQESPALARQIQQRAAAIKPDDAAGHQRLAQYLYNNRLYQQALMQVNEALKIKPDFQNAQLLKNLILAAMRPTATPTPAETGAGQSSSNAPSSQPEMTVASGQNLLTMKDVYKIRFWQLKRRETAPIEAKILHRRKTLMSFWRNIILRNPLYQNTTLTRRDYEHFISPNNLDRQIYLIRRLGTAKYWDKVQIQSDPQVMKIFRTDIEPIVLQSCGTVGCHRGQNAPGFRIYNDGAGHGTRKTYTNFLTITRFKYHGMSLISLHNPRMSLLLQYLQPKELQAYAHPGKKGPAPMHFNGSLVLNWIESLRYPTHSYGINAAPATTQSAKAKSKK